MAPFDPASSCDGHPGSADRTAITMANGRTERLIASIRRERLDHVVVFGEQHLRQLLGSYQRHYNDPRTHLSLNKDAPASRAVQAAGRITAVPHLGGLHQQYVRI
jgi:hypothetical protein